MLEIDFKTRVTAAITGYHDADQATQDFWRDTKLTFGITNGALHSRGVAVLTDGINPVGQLWLLAWDDLMGFWHWWTTDAESEDCQGGECPGCIEPTLLAVA